MPVSVEFPQEAVNEISLELSKFIETENSSVKEVLEAKEAKENSLKTASSMLIVAWMPSAVPVPWFEIT